MLEQLIWEECCVENKVCALWFIPDFPEQTQPHKTFYFFHFDIVKLFNYFATNTPLISSLNVEIFGTVIHFHTTQLHNSYLHKLIKKVNILHKLTILTNQKTETLNCYCASFSTYNAAYFKLICIIAGSFKSQLIDYIGQGAHSFLRPLAVLC